MSKWTRAYWTDLAERTASSAVGGVLAMITADASGAVSGSAQQWWLVVGVPTATTVLKCLLANLATGPVPSASLVAVSSSKGGGPAVTT